ncbi:hypothetical protein A9Q84_09800 [Halobacteriovorax marinus]|uniref:Uncharacterized protein n=1 Tax=Halobacteriovorax marinus TaxID=97084 RepID=A0A1Y5F6U8_9BACT|nr:hypothetical protein A9Q84_09800 [Halobacteriovorax marinus]
MNRELNTLWEDHWKSSTLEAVQKRYQLKEIFPNLENPKCLLKYFILAHIYNLNTSELLKIEITLLDCFKSGEFNKNELYIVFFFKNFFSVTFLEMLDESMSPELLESWNFAEHGSNFSEFSKKHFDSLKLSLQKLSGVKLILFLRKDRSYKGRMVLIDQKGKIISDAVGPWSLPALCKGRENKAFFMPNGQTPTGLYSINSVMPKADNTELFGEYRRLKLDFKSRENIEEILSDSLLEHPFWKSAVIASDLGRSLLRIHGTGLKNKKFYKKYHPFVTTSGCVSMRETSKFNDQRLLLNQLMKSMQLEETFLNEEEINGHLCIIELNDEKREVQLADIENLD